MTDGLGDNSSSQLRSGIERLERLAEEKKSITDDMSDVMSEMKAQGYDTKTVRKMIALRKMDPATRSAMLSIEETYMAALGLL